MWRSGGLVIEELQEVVTSETMIRLPKYQESKPVGAWLSLVEHSVRDRGVGGSNPLAPTKFPPKTLTDFRCSRVLGVGFGPYLAQNSHKYRATGCVERVCAPRCPELSQGVEAVR
jgi:hypothetical protein